MSPQLAEALRALEDARAAEGTEREAEADERAFEALAGAVVEIGGEVARRVLSRARETPWPEAAVDPANETEAELDADWRALYRFLPAFAALFPNGGDIALRAADDLIGFSQGQKAHLLSLPLNERGEPRIGRGNKAYIRQARGARRQIVLAISYWAALAEATETASADDFLTPDEDGRSPFAQWSEEVPAKDKALARALGKRAIDDGAIFTDAEWKCIGRWEALLYKCSEDDLRAMADGTTDLNAYFESVRKDRPI